MNNQTNTNEELTTNEIAQKVAKQLGGKFIGDNGYSNNGLVTVTIDGVEFQLTIRKTK